MTTSVNVEKLLVQSMNRASTLTAESLEAHMDIPQPRPSRFITVELTGGPVERYRSVPMVAVQIWAKSRYEASRLAEIVAAWLREELSTDPRVGRVTVASLYNFPDPDSGQPRYQLTVELVTQSA